MDNSLIADRLDAFAALLELGDANPYTARAYHRAAETIRSAPVPVAELVGSGRARELRGIGPGIETRLRELVETGRIAELEELERELAPDLIGLGRYLGLSARRSVELAQALGVLGLHALRGSALRCMTPRPPAHEHRGRRLNDAVANHPQRQEAPHLRESPPQIHR